MFVKSTAQQFGRLLNSSAEIYWYKCFHGSNSVHPHIRPIQEKNPHNVDFSEILGSKPRGFEKSSNWSLGFPGYDPRISDVIVATKRMLHYLHYHHNLLHYSKTMDISLMTTDTVVVDSSVRVTAVKSVTTGQELFDCLEVIPTGRDGKSHGYTFNRFIKVMFKEGKLPPDFSSQN